LGLQSVLFAGATCLPILLLCIRLCYRAQTEPIKFGPEFAATALVLFFGFAVVSFFLIGGIAWIVAGRCRVRVRSTWATLILGTGYGLLFVGMEWELLPTFAWVIGLLVMVPILFTRSRE
jgi:hypothetical protein